MYLAHLYSTEEEWGRVVNSSDIIQHWQERTESCYMYILTGGAQNLVCIRIT